MENPLIVERNTFISFAIILMGRDTDCFTLTVFLVACDWQCSVGLPHGAVVGSAVFDCGIF